MKGFDDIRPYRDDEVPEVLRRLLKDENVIHGAATLAAPTLFRIAPKLTAAVIKRRLERTVLDLKSINDIQRVLISYFTDLIKQTTSGFTWSGLELLDPGHPYLFVSNHRDIALDTGFMNYALWK